MRRSAVLISLVFPAGCSLQNGGSLAELDRRLNTLEKVSPAPRLQVTAHRSGTVHRDLDDSDDAVALSDGGSPWLDESEGSAAGDVASSSTSRRRPPESSFGETLKRDLADMPGDLWRDTRSVYGSAPNLVILGLTYGGSLALQETGPDDSIEDGYRHNSILSKSSRDAFGVLGNPGLHFALAGTWYLLGQQTQNDKTYEVGKTLLSALIINGLSTLTGQMATWDDAPNGEWGTFPSGHTSSTFALASVMHDAYGPLVGVPLYGVGVLVAMSRLEDGEHYFSDVIMGGMLGLVIGHTVAGEHEFELFGGKILPFADPNTGSSGLAWVKELRIK